MKFIIPGEPKGKARPRTVNGHTYTPDITVNYENWVRLCYKNAGGQHLGDRYIAVKILCCYGIPKSFSKRKRQDALDGKIKPDKKPDVDNIAKIVLDALNGIAYTDDKQVTDFAIGKRYAIEPRLEVDVREDGGYVDL